MKKTLITLTLALALVLGLGAASMASPLDPLDKGEFSTFCEYASGVYIFDWPGGQGYVIGFGYGLSDSLTLGAEVQFHDWWTDYGLYAKVSLDPFVISADFFYSTWTGGIYGKLVGLYVLDLKALKLGIGGGIAYADGDIGWIVEADASINLSKNCALYGGVGYDPDGLVFDAGISFTF